MAAETAFVVFSAEILRFQVPKPREGIVDGLVAVMGIWLDAKARPEHTSRLNASLVSDFILKLELERRDAC